MQPLTAVLFGAGVDAPAWPSAFLRDKPGSIVNPDYARNLAGWA